MSVQFKIYSRDKQILDRVCKDYNLTPDYVCNGLFDDLTPRVIGEGYVANDGYLRCFIENSHIDMSEDVKDITKDYVREVFVL